MVFRDSDKSFKLAGDLLETMTNYDFNVDHSNPQDRNKNYEFGKEMKFDIKQKGRPSNGDKSLIKLPNSPATMVSGVSTLFLPSDPKDFCDRLKLSLHQKQARNNSRISNEEVTVIVDKLIKYKSISKEQHKQILILM